MALYAFESKEVACWSGVGSAELAASASTSNTPHTVCNEFADKLKLESAFEAFFASLSKVVLLDVNELCSTHVVTFFVLEMEPHAASSSAASATTTTRRVTRRPRDEASVGHDEQRGSGRATRRWR